MNSHVVVLNLAKLYTPSVLCPTFTPTPAHVGMPDSHHYKPSPHHGSHILPFSSSPILASQKEHWEGRLQRHPQQRLPPFTSHSQGQPPPPSPPSACCGQRDRTS